MFFFFKQKTAYEMRISDWSSDVCSSDLVKDYLHKSVGMSGSFCFSRSREGELAHLDLITGIHSCLFGKTYRGDFRLAIGTTRDIIVIQRCWVFSGDLFHTNDSFSRRYVGQRRAGYDVADRAEEHTSERQ